MSMIVTEYTLPRSVRRSIPTALVVGLAAAALLVVGTLINSHQFFRSYLVGWLFWTGIAVGSLAILMIQHLSGGVWGATLRRLLEAAVWTIPIMGVLFLPILLFGMEDVYPWSRPEVVRESEILRMKDAYLNDGFFALRVFLYFAIWTFLGYTLINLSSRLDRTGDLRYRRRFSVLSGPGMVLFAITITLAGVDFIMSIEPEWFSTMFGPLVAIAMIISAHAFAIVVLALLTDRGPLRGVVTAEHFLDVGKLLLAFVILWTYINFSQFLIIYSGNLPLEAVYYDHRLKGGWEYLGLALLGLQFVLPFLLLLSRGLKEAPRTLMLIAGLVLVMQLANIVWLTIPSFRPRDFGLNWMDFVAPIAFGGVWLAMFLWRLSQRPILPLHVLPERHPRRREEILHAGR